MKYAIRHVTTYKYSSVVSGCHNVLHLTPRETGRQKHEKWEVEVSPEPEWSAEFGDYFGNEAMFFSIHQPHELLRVTASGVLNVGAFAVDVEKSPPWEEVRSAVRAHQGDDALDAFQYLWDSPFIKASPTLGGYARVSFPAGRPFLAGVMDLTHRIFREFKYKPQSTTISTPLEEVFEKRAGVCQDFAHLMIGGLRSMGLPARYVSGYLRTFPPKPDPAKPKVPILVGADASHAWLSVYCPGVGWVDFDPTNDVIPSDLHITLAWGRDYDDVSPIKGVVIGGGEHRLEVGVEVKPLE